MARGKQKKAAAHRSESALAAQIAQVRADIARERELRAQAEGRAADAARLSRAVDALRAETDAAVASAVRATEADVEVLERAVEVTEAALTPLIMSWRQVWDQLVWVLGGGPEGINRGLAAIGVVGSMRPIDTPGARRLSLAATQRIARARGYAREVTAEDRDGDGVGALGHLIAPPLSGDDHHPDPARAAAYVRAERAVTQVVPASRDEASLYAAHPPTWVKAMPLQPYEDLDELPPEEGADEDSDGDSDRTDTRTHIADDNALQAGISQVRRLGVTADAAVYEPDTIRPATLAQTAGRTIAQVLADTDAREAVQDRLIDAAGRLVTPWAPRPAYPRPSDAGALRYWYAQAARGEAVRHQAWHADTLAHPADEPREDAPDGPEQVERAHEECSPLPGCDHDLENGTAADSYRLLARAMAAAVPFWLPPSQASSFLASDALTQADLDDLRLPYPAVLVAPSDPVRLEPTVEPNAQLYSRLFQLDAGVRRLGSKPKALWPTLSDFDVAVLSRPTGREELLAVRGADVEAVLLLGDDTGRLADTFAWCLAIRGRAAAPVIRLILPARRSRCAYAAEIGNLAAVAAWADWHATEEPDMIPRQRGQLAPAMRAAAARGAGSGVRVLDLRSTGGGVRSETVTGKSVAPHLRRGHWRRQHYGPRNTLVRRVRIGPVLVNAGAGELLPQIYRLPQAGRD